MAVDSRVVAITSNRSRGKGIITHLQQAEPLIQTVLISGTVVTVLPETVAQARVAVIVLISGTAVTMRLKIAVQKKNHLNKIYKTRSRLHWPV